MNLSEKFSYCFGFYSQELYYLLQFVRDIDAYISHQAQDIDKIPDMPSNTKREFTKFIAEFGELFGKIIAEEEGHHTAKGEIKREFKPLKGYPQEVTKYLFPFLTAILKPIKYPVFLYDMTVTHSIALFESFLHEFLVAIFTLRPNALKSENTATYEEILSFSSKKDLIGHLSSSRADKILEGDLKRNVAKKLNDVFSINIFDFEKLDTLYEAFCRRHIIVHNGGKTDKEYCQKIPNSKIRELLSTDLQYIEALLMTMGQFMDYLDGHFSRKMRYRRNPFANQLLNPPDSMGELRVKS